MSFAHTARIFVTFLWRDASIYWKLKTTYFVNYILIYPPLYACAFLFLGSRVFFGQGNELAGTTLFVGNIIVTMMTLTSKLAIDLLFDFEHQRFIDYQITLLSPRLVILERIVFTALFTSILLACYFPIAKLLLQDYFVTTATSWLALEGMVFLGSLFCASYQVMIYCALKSSAYISQVWVRFNQPLLILGGFWVPLHILKKFSATLGFVCHFNPFIYISEGLRQAALAGDQFLPIGLCCGALLLATCICTCLAWYFFKQRTDHI